VWRCGPLSVLIPSVCPKKRSTPEEGPRALETMLLFTSMKLSEWLSTTHVGQEMNKIIINIEIVQKLCRRRSGDCGRLLYVWSGCGLEAGPQGRFGGIMGPDPAQMINGKQRDGIMENNLGLGTLPKTPHMTSAAHVLATYPKTDPPTLVGVHTHMGLLFSPISPPLPELAHATRRASEGDPGLSRSASRNPTLGSSLRKPFIKRCGKVSPPTFSDGLPGGKGPCGPSKSKEKTYPRVRVTPRSPPINIRCVAMVVGGGAR
jgi:hypothetical protein